jgi:predicted nucleotidyltransferase
MERRITPQHESIYESQMDVHARYHKALDEFLSRALEGYGERIVRIILFGSVARKGCREE